MILFKINLRREGLLNYYIISQSQQQVFKDFPIAYKEATGMEFEGDLKTPDIVPIGYAYSEIMFGEL